jgi:hypothetical protein
VAYITISTLNYMEGAYLEFASSMTRGKHTLLAQPHSPYLPSLHLAPPSLGFS